MWTAGSSGPAFLEICFMVSYHRAFPLSQHSNAFSSDLTIAALRVLLSRSNGQRRETDACSTLYKQVYEAALGCHGMSPR